jgi:hypothetical protein
MDSKAGLLGIAVGGMCVAVFLFGQRSAPEKTAGTARVVSATLQPAVEPVEDREPVDEAKPAPTVTKANPASPPNRNAPVAERPRRPLIIREIDAPLGPHTKPEDWGKASDYLFQNVYLSPDVTRVVTVASKEAVCWETASGKRRHAFAGPAQSLTTYVAPGGRTYVELRSDRPATATVRSTETGHVIGTYAVKKPALHGCSLKPGFTPGGDWFVFCERQGQYHRLYATFHAVSTRTGRGRILTKKITAGDEDFSLEHLYLQPVPNAPTILLYFPNTLGGLVPARVCAFDTRMGSPTGFPAMTTKPRELFNSPGYGLKLSADGRLLLGLDFWGDLQICDVRTGRLVCELKKPRNHWSRLDGVLTPDGQRVVTLNQPTAGHRNWFYLHDLATGAELGGFDSHQLGLPDRAEAKRIEISRDGKILAVMCSHKVVLVDFEAAFQTSPLPPLKVEPEALP